MNKELEAVLNRLDLFNLDIKKNIEDIYNRLYITFDDNEISYLLDYIEELKKENNKLNHYKKLYQSVKKHKEDLREFLKNWVNVLENERGNVEGLDLFEEHQLETLYDILAKLEEIEGVEGV